MKEYNQLLMNKKELKKLSKSQLIDRLMKLEKSMKKPDVVIIDDTKPSVKRNFIIPPPPQFRDRRPIPLPRKSVKSMVNAYEQNIILPPPQFRDEEPKN